MKVTIALLLLLALVCMAFAQQTVPPSNGDDSDETTSTSNEEGDESDSRDYTYHPTDGSQSSSTGDGYPPPDDSYEYENGRSGDDDGYGSGDDSGNDASENQQYDGSYIKVRIILVVSVDNLPLLLNNTKEIIQSFSSLFNISDTWIRIHFRHHDDEVDSSEFFESGDKSDEIPEDEYDDEYDSADSGDDDDEDSGDAGYSSGDAGENDDSSTAVEPTRAAGKGRASGKSRIDVIIDLAIPTDRVNNHVADSSTIQTALAAAVANPNSKLAKTLATGGASEVSAATAGAAYVLPTADNNTTATSPPSSNTTVPIKASASAVASSFVVAVFAAVALVL